MGFRRAPLAERFWEKVDKSGDCWIWIASRDGCGYGTIGVRTHFVQRAHRVSWEMANGPIPDGMLILHRCDNPPRVRPDHLFIGTQYDNMRDASQKLRLPIGEANGRAKLTASQVLEVARVPNRGRMRGKSDDSNRALAEKYGVSTVTISRIRSGKTRVTC